MLSITRSSIADIAREEAPTELDRIDLKSDSERIESHELVGCVPEDGSTTLIFKTSRWARRSRAVPADWISPEHIGRIGYLPEITLRSNEPHLAFDSVRIPSDLSEPVVIAIGTLFKDCHPSHNSTTILHSFVDRSLRDRFGVDTGNPINIFGAIDYVYKNVHDDARLGALKSDSTTGATRDERMRMTRIDLRKELFHAAGSAKAKVFPFDAAIRLPASSKSDAKSKRGDEVEIRLRGNRQMLDGQEPLVLAEVSNARNSLDFTQAVESLISWVRGSENGQLGGNAEDS